MEANENAVHQVENAGGFVVNPHPAWGFYHGICLPTVYMIPAEKTEEFQTELGKLPRWHDDAIMVELPD
jgi:hypothetical protein